MTIRSSYKQDILDLNYCLFNQAAATTLIRNDSVMMVNPRNPGHQQSNLCCRIRIDKEDQSAFDTFLQATMDRFLRLGLQPRYIVDELATPSLDTLATWFKNNKQYTFHVERDTDIIMSCTFEDFKKIKKNNSSMVRKATLEDVEELTQLIGAAFGYNNDNTWLRYKLTTQINDPQTQIYGLVENGQQFLSVAILNAPDGLPDLIHVNVCGTHPDHQRKGLGLICLQQALGQELQQGQTAYLEVYDDIVHAQRMYEKLGFKAQGTMDSLTVTLPRQ
ncbi:acyl-CoA N-acyltransferase [Halteromyces radiatus]|uniref:acyl-CoA N-acyltransferase n=1 Tax=Halteromyces radiatus TaxID=101107 RepID=UPI002220E8F5|nr:acyl-CoA N-acyltransferase [Halteromyces radiatus]KAI8078882.1 acyl-CoA N-acyltransferase [Halteromyces radiatus]